MPTIRELLASDPGAVNARALVRAIAEHPEWYVPMLSFEGRDQFGHVVLPADGRLGAVPNELWLFTDPGAVERAPQQLGFGSMSGIEVCANLSPALETAQLNPGSPDYLSMKLPPVVRNQLAQLAKAVPLEREFEQVGGSGAIQSLVAHPLFFIAITSGAPICVPSDDGKIARGILVFTAADGVDGLFERVASENRASIQINSMSGRDLFGKLRGEPIDAVLLNLFGPRGKATVAGEDLVRLIALVE